MMHESSLLFIVAVLLPPAALDILGNVVEERVVATPYGDVGPLARRCLDESTSLWIQPYTGSTIRTDPRATIFAAKSLGIRHILNWDRVVAVNPTLQRGQTALVGDYVDWIRRLPVTMGEPGVTLPSSFDRSSFITPYCTHIASPLQAKVPSLSPVLYLGVDSNRRETQAEARLFRAWQIDVVGYNLMPEVLLANEVDICYAGMVTVSDFGADQPSAPARGEVRESLNLVTNALPDVVRAILRPGECMCRGRSS